MPSPELVLSRPKPGCRLSIVLLDWGVRESFHSLHYLNQQTVARDQYEVIWLEFYGRKPQNLREMVFRSGTETPLLDQWIVAGYGDDIIFNKHRLYNLGLLVSQGQYCVICDSDAIFTPNFVVRLLEAFAHTPRAVLHLDEIRNAERRFHPFAYPAIAEVLGPGCINWQGTLSRGLDNSQDIIHEANYGACMAAARTDLLAIGGADEHLDYLGYICGPYDMTFRLVNHGLEERWLRDEYLYHVWHPNEGGINTDYQGPSDGRGMSLRSLESRLTGRVQPWLENPWIRQARQGTPLEMRQLLEALAARDEPTWRNGQQPSPDAEVFLLEADYHGFNLFRHRRHWYGLKMEDGYLDPNKARRYRLLLDGKDVAHVKHLVNYYNNLPKTWLGRLAHQPFYRLPWRAARRLGKEISRLF
jgi:glycosyltransferase involved in cell wall biosynthesis